MSAEQNVRYYLAANAGRRYCDDCLSVVLQIKPRQQVQQKTSKLAGQPSLRRGPGICSRCHSNKVVIEALGYVAHESPGVYVPGSHAASKSAARKETIDLVGALVLISCVKSKQAASAPARQLYTSTWFRGVRDLVEASGARWLVLSSCYGLVAPEMVIMPYDYTLNSLGVAERRAWAKNVLDSFYLKRSLTDVS